MKYLCLIYEDEKLWQKMPKADVDKLFAEYAVFKEGMKESGHLVACNPLQPSHTATTVRVRDGKISATDGPFAETREQLGGYFLFEATDLNEAIQVAGKIPGARIGCVEVRPIADDPRTRTIGSNAAG